MNEVKIGSNKSFGIVFSIIFFIIAIFPILSNDNIRVWSLVISLIFLVLGLINSKLLSPLNKIWFKFGLILSKVVSPVIMGIIFFLVVTPIGILIKILKKDLLNLKYNNKNTYWIEKKDSESTMKNQF